MCSICRVSVYICCLLLCRRQKCNKPFNSPAFQRESWCFLIKIWALEWDTIKICLISKSNNILKRTSVNILLRLPKLAGLKTSGIASELAGSNKLLIHMLNLKIRLWFDFYKIISQYWCELMWRERKQYDILCQDYRLLLQERTTPFQQKER